MFANNLFEGKVALVTGGRSGIGFGIAKSFLQLGASVVICSRDEKKLEKAGTELATYGDCKWLKCDIRDQEDIKSLMSWIMEIHGKLDILINNAGGQFPVLADVFFAWTGENTSLA